MKMDAKTLLVNIIIMSFETHHLYAHHLKNFHEEFSME